MMTALDIFAALPQKRKEKVTKRFWEKIRKGDKDDCWEWTAGKDKDGYGKVCFGGGKRAFHVRSHRMAWVIGNQKILPDLFVCHTCDNPQCCNLKHLFVGTHQDNVNDMIKKGRNPWGDANGSRLHPEKMPRGESHFSRRHPEKMARGESSGKSKLTETKVREIRALYAAGGITQKELAKKFSLVQQNIWLVVNNKTWKHVQPPQTLDDKISPETASASHH